jgi:hypothetical protein
LIVTNSVTIAQKTLIPLQGTIPITVFREITYLYCKNRTIHVCAFEGEHRAFLYIETGALKVEVTISTACFQLQLPVAVILSVFFSIL